MRTKKKTLRQEGGVKRGRGREKRKRKRKRKVEKEIEGKKEREREREEDQGGCKVFLRQGQICTDEQEGTMKRDKGKESYILHSMCWC